MKKKQSNDFSTLTQMYSSWQQFKIPATFYHYFLTILKNKSKQQQLLLMQKQISSLKTGTNLYLKIKIAIEARENSLQIIKANLPLLLNRQILSKPIQNINIETDILGYKKLFQTKQNIQERIQNRQMRQLANHLMIYRKITIQIIFLIHKWMAQIITQGYQGIIQFLYNNQDYLQQITEKTLPILQKYKAIFQFNPFFILKKQRVNGQYGLVFQFLKITPQYAKNLYQALKLLAQHHTTILKVKMLGKHSLNSSNKKIIKSQSIDKIYGNLLSHKDYYLIKDSQLKSDKIIQKQQYLSQKIIQQKLIVNRSHKKLNNSSILINPQLYPKPNFVERKYPTFFSDNTQNQDLKSKKQNQFNDFLFKRRNSSNIQTIKHQQSIVYPKMNNPYQYEINRGLQAQYNMRNLNQLNQKRTVQTNNINKNFSSNFIKNIKENKSLMLQSQLNHDRSYQKRQQISNQSQMIVQTQNYKVDIEKNLYPTHIMKYLRELFKKQLQLSELSQNSSSRMNLKKVQQLAKFLLSQRQHITILKIVDANKNQFNEEKNRKYKKVIAWIVCKLHRDPICLQKTVDLLYVYQFQKFNEFNIFLIEYFKEIGYFIMKQNGKIVSQVNNNSLQDKGKAIIRIKYKISTKVDQDQIKEVIKNNTALKMSRILKYHYYNKSSKYHKYCQHKSKQETCSISYYFDSISRIFINNKQYIKVKIDSIKKINQCYKVYHHLNNSFLVIAFGIQDLKQFQKYEQNNQMQNDESYDDQKELNYKYLCFQQGKTMKKYVNQRQKPVINQFIWIQNNIPQLISISIDKHTIIGNNYLVVSKPYVIAFYGKQREQNNKSLAVMDFFQ